MILFLLYFNLIFSIQITLVTIIITTTKTQWLQYSLLHIQRKQQISTRTCTKKKEQKHKIGKTLSLVVYENFLFDCITLLN